MCRETIFFGGEHSQVVWKFLFFQKFKALVDQVYPATTPGYKPKAIVLGMQMTNFLDNAERNAYAGVIQDIISWVPILIVTFLQYICLNWEKT